MTAALLGCLFVGVPGVYAATTPATASNYLNDALIDGTLVQRWNDETRVIEVTIQPGTNVKGWQPKMVDLVKASFAEWQKALGGHVRFAYTTDPMQTDVVVKWQPQPDGLEIGHQNIRWTNNTLTDAEIDIALLNPHRMPLSDMEIKYVALHEIGHVLGIRGHSNNPQDVMYPTLQPKTAKLSNRDIATIQALYQQKADITNPSGIHLLQYRQFDYYVRLGYEAHQQKNHEAAYNYFVKAKEYYPKDSHIIYWVGISAYNAKKYDVAITNLEQAMQMDNADQVNAEYYLANALMAEGSQEILDGNKTSGIEKLHQAKQHYDTVQNNPKASLEIRKTANSKLDTVSTQFR